MEKAAQGRSNNLLISSRLVAGKNEGNLRHSSVSFFEHQTM